MTKRWCSNATHHYFDLNAKVVFEVTTEHIEDLQGVLKKIVLNVRNLKMETN